MDYNDLGYRQCEIRPREQDIKIAGKMVSIDFTQPIDLSQMVVYRVDACQIADEDRWYFLRNAVLRAFVFNEDGEQEELEITFKLKSQRLPKI